MSYKVSQTLTLFVHVHIQYVISPGPICFSSQAIISDVASKLILHVLYSQSFRSATVA